MEDWSRCLSPRPVLLSAGLLFCVLAAHPGHAYAGWVVESEPAVLVGYGESYVSELGIQTVHHGIDCLASAGARCLFPAEGTVSFVGRVPAGDTPGCGTTLAVSTRIEDGRTVTLMPLDSVTVSEGQHVSAGDVAGLVASSGDGSTTLPHVHVGLKEGRTYYDPSELLGLPAVRGADNSGAEESPQAVAPLVQGQSPLPSGASIVDEDLVAGAGMDVVTPAVPAYESAVEAARRPVGQGEAEAGPASVDATRQAEAARQPEDHAPAPDAPAATITSSRDARTTPREAWAAVQEPVDKDAREGHAVAELARNISALARSVGWPAATGAALALAIAVTAAALARCTRHSKEKAPKGKEMLANTRRKPLGDRLPVRSPALRANR